MMSPADLTTALEAFTGKLLLQSRQVGYFALRLFRVDDLQSLVGKRKPCAPELTPSICGSRDSALQQIRDCREKCFRGHALGNE
jgi:hypothetical protein